MAGWIVVCVLLFVFVGALFVPAVGFSPPPSPFLCFFVFFCWSVICSGCRFYATTVALFGVLCFSRFPRCCQSSSKRCVRQLLFRQSSLNRCSRQVLLRQSVLPPCS